MTTMIRPIIRKPKLYGTARIIYPATPITIPSKKKTAFVHSGLLAIIMYAIPRRIRIIDVASVLLVNVSPLTKGRIPMIINKIANINPKILKVLTRDIHQYLTNLL